MSKFKNFFRRNYSQKRDFYFEFPNLIKNYEIYAYIIFSASLKISLVQGTNIQKFYLRLKFVTFRIVCILSKFQS